MLGSVCHPDPRVRRKAIDHLLECVDIMDATGSRDLKLWFADGTNYPGQDDIRARQDRLAEALADRLRPARRRPADGPRVQAVRAVVLHDGRARLGDRARPLRGARAARRWSSSTPATTRRAPTSSSSSRRCCGPGKLGGVRLQLAVLRRRRPDGRRRPTRSSCSGSCTRSCRPTRCGPRPGVAFMLDQCHNIEPKIPGQIRSVMNVQEATAKALLVDRPALAAAQAAGDVLGANAVLMDAYNTDVRPLLARAARAASGLDPDPMARLRAVGLRRRGSSPSASAAARPAGAHERRRPRSPEPRRSLDRSQPPRRRPAQHQLRRRQHLGQGHRRSTRSPAAPVELLWVKGSGGDLGTLTEAGLAVLRLDRLRALVDVYPGVEREDEMVAAFDYCLHGRGGAAPSIDTAMHGLVDAAHVDHLHPDSGIALATAADGEALTARVLRRPGRLGALAAARLPARPRHRRDPARPTRRRSARSSAATASPPGATRRDACEAQLARDHPDRRARSSPSAAEPSRSAPSSPGYEPLPEAERRARAAALLPLVRGLASTDRPQVGHFTDSRRRPRLPRRAPSIRGWPRSGTSCPDHFLRTKVRPMVLDLPPTAPLEDVDRAAARAARGVPRRLRGLLRAPRRRRTARRCAAPTRRSSSSRASGCSASARTSRPRGSPASSTSTRSTSCAAPRRVSTYAPIPEAEKFRIEYWALEEAKLARMPKPKPLADPGRVRDRRRLGHRPGDRPSARRRGRLRRRRRHRRGERRGRGRARSAGRTSRSRSPSTSPTRRRSPPPSATAVLAFGGVDLVVNNAGLSISKPLLETTVARLGPPARRDGPRLVPRLARGGADHDRPGHGRRPRLHRQQERVLRRPEQRRLRRVQGRPGAPGPAARRRARRSTGSGSTASTPTASSAARGSSPRAGARTGRGRTASPRTSSASSTPSGRCSSARSCPSTSRPRCSP